MRRAVAEFICLTAYKYDYLIQFLQFFASAS